MGLLRHVTAWMVLVTVGALLPAHVAGQGRDRRDDSRNNSEGANRAPFGGQGGQGWGGQGWGGGGGRNRWMDRDGDGQIEPGEVPDFMRERFESSLRDAGVDPRRPVSVDRYDELTRQRLERSGFGASGGQGGGQGGGRDGGRDDRDRRRDDRRRDEDRQSAQGAGQSAAEPLLVPGFGNEFEETPVATFGDAVESADAWTQDYDANVVRSARDIVQRYDSNRNGILERSEWKAVQWRNDPNASDRNKDGKLTLQEFAERLATQARDDERDRGRRGGPGGGLGATSTPSTLGQAVGAAGTPGAGAFRFGMFGGGGMWGGGGGNRRGGPGGGAPGFTWPGGGVTSGSDGGGDDLSAMSFGEGDGEADDSAAATPSEAGREGLGGGGRKRGRGGNNTGGPGPAGGVGSSKTATKSSAAKPAPYRFQTSQELLAKDKDNDKLASWFVQRDKNGDGQVSMFEFATVWSEAEVGRFQGWDANGDGVITPVEAKGGGQSAPPAATPVPSTRTARAQSPPAEAQDSSLETTADADMPATEAQAAPVSTPGKAASAPSSVPTSLPQDLLAQARKRIASLDKNENGMADRDEWPTAGLLPYATIDANQDAKVTAEEIAAYQLAIREKLK